ELRNETAEVMGLGPDQQMADEQRMPGKFADDSHREAMSGISTAIKVLHIKMLVLGMGQHVAPECGEMFSRYGFVAVPPDRRLALLVAPDEFVVGRAARLAAGRHDERTALGHPSLAAAQRFLIELGHT